MHARKVSNQVSLSSPSKLTWAETCYLASTCVSKDRFAACCSRLSDKVDLTDPGPYLSNIHEKFFSSFSMDIKHLEAFESNRTNTG